MSEPTPATTLLRTWRHAPLAWQAARWLTPTRIDGLLRLRSAAGLPIGRARFRAMGLPDEAIEATLRRVRSLADWDLAWTWSAHRFLGEARRLAGDGRPEAAALARRHAALCDHVASFLTFDDPRKMRALRASATSLFAQTVPTLLSHVERVEVAWRTARLPGYLARPILAGPAPLAVFLNGATTAKEETILWASRFLAHGFAVLALDQPGTGEAALTLDLTADCDDFTDGLYELTHTDPELDDARLALLGFSLGGALAVRAAAYDRRVAAVVAVTPPFDAATWLPAANPLLVAQLATLANADAAHDLIDGFALPEVAARLRCPLLTIGAGRDVIVPPGEAARLCAAAGDLGTLLWFPDAGHGLYDAVADWTDDAARWLAAVMDAHPSAAESTGVDPIQIPITLDHARVEPAPPPADAVAETP